MLISSQLIGFGAGETKYIANAGDFDGTSDFANRAADLDMSDGEDFLISLWFNIQGGNATARRIISAVGDRFEVARNASDEILVSFLTVGGSALWQFTSTATFTTSSNPGWHHLLVAAELDASPVAQIFLDDVALAGTDVAGPTNGTLDMTRTDWDIGQRSDNSEKWFGFLSEVWFNNEFLDISVQSNRRKFINSQLKPVSLGENGNKPTGLQPSAYFRLASPSWESNQGSGGGFTENGTIGIAASSPSD